MSPCREATQHSVHPTGGSLRVFKHFAWLGVGSGKMALSHPAHPRVTLTVGRLGYKDRYETSSSGIHNIIRVNARVQY